jgi:4'-phosphopantetheinyl transferase EntD
MQDDIAAVLRAMLGPAVGIGVSNPKDTFDDLWPTERPAIARAIPKRQYEFAAGRRAARQAMAELGIPAQAIVIGDQRAPVWPGGVTGSIAHCDSICIAAISKTHRSMGIDIEPATPLPADLIPIVCTEQEQAKLPKTDAGMIAKRIFCAKEAVYKAQYPLTGEVIGFDALSIHFNQDDTFDATLPNLPPLHGKLRTQHDLILASVTI